MILERTRLKVSDIDAFEVNESLGDPVAATGAILTVKALHEIARIGGRYALVTTCIGDQGIAAIYERL